MNILITGGTGFVGHHLKEALVKQEHHIFILTRSPQTHHNTDQITYLSYGPDLRELPPIDVVIHLAGESLFGYWTEQKKNAFYQVDWKQRIK